AETYANPPKYVHQQFALMVVLFFGGQFDFKNLTDETIICIKADFENMLNFTNFETLNNAALLQGYNQIFSNQTAIKRFLKLMSKALIIQSSTKNHNVDWDWNEINWSEVVRKLYIIYKMNQTTESHCWPKYDFIRNIIDIHKKDLDPYFNNTTRGTIIEEQLYSYFD
ncbi:16874_t:CDS:1, partial [Racocetra persica]